MLTRNSKNLRKAVLGRSARLRHRNHRLRFETLECRWLLTGTTLLANVGNLNAFGHAVSDNGRYVAFYSFDSTLVSGDSNGVSDVFVRDLVSGTTTRVSTSTSGTQANFNCGIPSISADGNFVTFYTAASNLVAGDNNGEYDIFRKDFQTGVLTRVSTSSTGAEANRGSTQSSMSADGRFVAFDSGASNLVSGDTNGYDDIFVKDTLTGTTIRASTDAAGNQGIGGSSSAPSMSADGRYVAFYSSASNLVPGDTNGTADVFVKDLQTGAITRVSTDAHGVQGNDLSSGCTISGNGRFVSFESTASNFVPGDTNGTYDVFVKDLQTGSIQCISTTPGGAVGNGSSFNESVSDDGRLVAFRSGDTNLVAGDTNSKSDVFLRDVSTGTTARVSVDSSGGQFNFDSYIPSISGDGQVIVFAGSNESLYVTGNPLPSLPSLTVTVNSDTWQIGTPFPQFTATYAGFQNGDGPSVLGGTLVFTTSANQNSTVGTYAVSASGLTSNDYTIIFVNGTLTVTPAIVGIDIRPTSLNIDQNGAISLVVYGSTAFDVTRVSTSSLKFAGVSVDVFQSSLTDVDKDGKADLLLNFRTSDAIKAALTSMYSDLLLNDYADDNQYSTKENALIALDGAFGEFGQEFHGTDSTTLFLAGNSLKSLLTSLSI